MHIQHAIFKIIFLLQRKKEIISKKQAINEKPDLARVIIFVIHTHNTFTVY